MDWLWSVPFRKLSEGPISSPIQGAWSPVGVPELKNCATPSGLRTCTPPWSSFPVPHTFSLALIFSYVFHLHCVAIFWEAASGPLWNE